MGIIKLGSRFVEINKIPSEVFVRNKLSKKPQEAVEPLRKIIDNQLDYHLSMKQDYSKNTVILNLLSRCYVCNTQGLKNFENGHQIYQSSELPVTSALNTYKKTVQQMLENNSRLK